MDTPDLKLLLERVQDTLQSEAEKRDEFYEWLTPEIKAEFINGEVVMHSPAKRKHLEVNEHLFILLHTWVRFQSLGKVSIEKALIALTRNDYEPDICFWRKEVADAFDGDTMRHPAPDLVVEVLSKSTEARDRGIKFQDYAAHGIQEYWLVDADQETVEAFTLNLESMGYEGGERLTVKDTLKSHAVPGFEIPVRAIFEPQAYAAAVK